MGKVTNAPRTPGQSFNGGSMGRSEFKSQPKNPNPADRTMTDSMGEAEGRTCGASQGVPPKTNSCTSSYQTKNADGTTSGGSITKETTGCSGKKSSPAQAFSKLYQKARKAYATDIKDVKAAWKSDNLAFDMLTKFAAQVAKAAPNIIADILNMARDGGSGEYASVSQKECKAMLDLCKKLSPAKFKQVMELCNPNEMMKHMKDPILSEFKALCKQHGVKLNGDTKAPSQSAPAPKSKASSKNPTAEFNKLYKEARQAYAQDIKNPKAAWKSDNLAFDMLTKFAAQVAKAAPNIIADILNMARDGGSGKFASVSQKECKAMLDLCKKLSPAKFKQVMELCNPNEMMKHMKDPILSEFKALCKQHGVKLNGAAGAQSTNPNQPTSKEKAFIDQKFSEMQKALAKDLKNPAAAWASDDLAREFITKNPGLLNKLSPEQLMFLSDRLLDKGSGKYASVNSADLKALKTVTTVLNQKIRALRAQAKSATTSGTAGANSNNGTSSSHGTNSSHGTSGSGNAGSGVNGTGSSSHTQGSSSASDGNFSSAFKNLEKGLIKSGQTVQDLMKQFENEKDPHKRQVLSMKLQQAMQAQRQLFELMSKLLKQMHEMAMSAIRNM